MEGKWLPSFVCRFLARDLRDAARHVARRDMFGDVMAVNPADYGAAVEPHA